MFVLNSVLFTFKPCIVPLAFFSWIHGHQPVCHNDLFSWTARRRLTSSIFCVPTRAVRVLHLKFESHLVIHTSVFFQLDSRAFVCHMRFLPEALWDFFKLFASVSYSVPTRVLRVTPIFWERTSQFFFPPRYTLSDSCVTTVFLEAFQTCFSLVDSLWYFPTDPREFSNPCVTIVIFGTLFNCLADESVTRVTWTPGLDNGNQYAKTLKGGTPYPKESRVNTNLCKARNNNELT